jgi:hypothetical protein
MTYIYLVENCYGDFKKIYIGKSVNPKYRKNKHKLKFGKLIQFTIIDSVNSVNKKDWEPLECFWIEQFKQWGFDIQNKNNGGGGPSNHSNQTIDLMKSSGNRKKSRRKWAKPKFKKEGPKYQKPIGWGDKLKTPRLTLQKPIYQFDKNNNKIAEFSNIKEAIIKTNIKGIYNSLTGLAKSAGGYIWKYK